MLFNIRPGRYTLPHWGKIDTSKVISNERLLELYEHKGFPFIAPKNDKKTIAFLKKQKLSNKRIAALVLRAQTEEEIEILLKVNDSDAIKNIAATRLKALKK